jgi:hypothetical protein
MLETDFKRASYVRQLMEQPAYRLDGFRRTIVLRSLLEILFTARFEFAGRSRPHDSRPCRYNRGDQAGGNREPV